MRRNFIALKKWKMSDLTVCPRCGTTIEDFRRTGLLGCAACYRAFRGEILATVRRVQGNTHHEGGVRAASEEKYSFMLERQHLKEEIERAMREGRYAEAEELQQRLKESDRTRRREEQS